jgi:ATP-dependent DNA helicase RecQ
MLWQDKVIKYLDKLNISKLKKEQENVINEILLGNDVIGLLPTGYGKSLCYILPPLLKRKVMIVISPLISLMDEQCNKLLEKGINACALNTNNNNKGNDIKNITSGKIKIVFMSPEYLINGYGLDLANQLIKNELLGFLAVDECHCVSVWGQDFRNDYTLIKSFRDNFPNIPIMALTATATSNICSDVIKYLSLKDPTIIRASFDRPNLKIDMIQYNAKLKKKFIIKSLFEKYKGSKIIVYTHTRNETELLANELNRINISCYAYHAGLTKEQRHIVQEEFSNDKSKYNIIISTIAFGMGIDQIVRCVVIFGFPSSIEEYFQQIGRAGRDGINSDTILYYDYSCYRKREYGIKNLNDYALSNAKMKCLISMKTLIYLKTCRRRYILDYFDEPITFMTCNNCDNCNKELIDISSNILKSKSYNDIIKLTSCDMGIYNLVISWKKWVKSKKILNENEKFKIPKEYLINNKDDDLDDFDKEIKKFEKMI